MSINFHYWQGEYVGANSIRPVPKRAYAIRPYDRQTYSCEAVGANSIRPLKPQAVYERI